MIQRSSFYKSRLYFHLACRVSDRYLSPTQLKSVWNDLPSRFHRLRFIELHSCVLMSNHLHALLSVEPLYFDFVELSLQEEIKKLAFFSVENWQPNCFEIRRIDSFAQYREVYRYIYRNPLEAGLVPLAEMYEFSTLFEILGHGKKKLCANDNMGLITNPFPLLNWINWGSLTEKHSNPIFWSTLYHQNSREPQSQG